MIPFLFPFSRGLLFPLVALDKNSFSGFDLSESLTIVSCKNQPDLDAQHVIITASLSMM